MKITDSVTKLPPRNADSHKGDFGKVCIIAGSTGMAGAAALAGRACLRAGAGLVRVAVAKSTLPIVAAIEPSYTTIALPEDEYGQISFDALPVILNATKENDVIAFGPGVGVSDDLKKILEYLIKIPELALIIDADGLNNLSKLRNWHEISKASLILTPHPGEMKRLWASVFREKIPDDRQQIAGKFAELTNTTVVLKGAGTIVTDGKRLFLNTTGNAGMATAGAGDCLTGTITALKAQKMSFFDSAVLGVYIHGLAGDIAAKKKGQISLIATDIIDCLSDAFMKI
ncbi:MAG TPA: NAD(P)H-hydrate dehydratase [Sedimentisphaerales bacterium]|nr:NAD(P)H-hydrate dehydratase [Sedimentisphaerales bacterium]